MNKVILAISAHPDDIEFACGGTMFKLKDIGYEIYLIVATNGENGFKIGHKPKKERIQIRHKEQLKAAKILGIKKVFFLNYRDGYLKYNDELRAKLAKIIKLVKPEIIFTFDPSNKSFESVNLLHHDHRAIAEASFDAVFAARNRYMFAGEPHTVSYFYFFGPDKPNYFENITNYINKKIKLIEAHRSQFSDYASMSEWVKKHLSQYTKKYKYSEKFRVVEIQTPFIMKKIRLKRMFRVSEEVFHELMKDAIETIPDLFKDKIDNLAFIIEPYPAESDMDRIGLKDRYTLLGLYSGIPFTHRNTGYMGVTPDRIILFQKNIEALCDSIEELKEKIREVVVHEVAHYFGMDEDEIRQAGY